MTTQSNFSRSTTGVEVVKAFSKQVEGKTILLTGASAGGLGAQTLLSLAHVKPATLLLLGRTPSKIDPVIKEIKSISPTTDAKFVSLDLCNLASTRKTAAEVNNLVSKIDVVINNAGVMAVNDYEKTADGIEMQFGANHVGPFLLTNLLIKGGKLAEGGRLVNVTSMGYETCGVRFEDWNFEDGKSYNPWLAYGQSKTANVLFAKSLAKKLEKKGGKAFVVHPGLILSSNLMSNVTPETFAQGIQMANEANGGNAPPMEEQKTLEQGCSTTLVAALDPGLGDHSGTFLRDAQIVPEAEIKKHATDEGNMEKLWKLSEEIIGEKFDL